MARETERFVCLLVCLFYFKRAAVILNTCIKLSVQGWTRKTCILQLEPAREIRVVGDNKKKLFSIPPMRRWAPWGPAALD